MHKIDKCLLIDSIRLPKEVFADKQIAAYMDYNWKRCTSNDGLEEAFHVAASYGRRDLCNWLFKMNPGILNSKDAHGCTALHKSIIYGNFDTAIMLTNLGADMEIKNREAFSPVDLLNAWKLRSDKMKCGEIEFLRHTELYVCGTNANYNLGLSGGGQKRNPKPMDFFNKKNIRIISVSMSENHTIFLSDDGTAWSCGIGTDGKLGHNNEQIAVIPQKIIFSGLTSSCCSHAAVGRDHSLFVCDQSVYVCGNNAYGQLGVGHFKPVLVPELAFEGHVIRDIAAGANYSVILEEGKRLFGCGFSGGQFGSFERDTMISTFTEIPIKFSSNDWMEKVAVCDTAIVILTANMRVYILNSYRIHVIKDIFDVFHLDEATKRQMMDDVKIAAYGAAEKSLKVAMVHEKKLYLWHDGDTHFLPCRFQETTLSIRSVTLNDVCIMFVTMDGFVCWTKDYKKEGDSHYLMRFWMFEDVKDAISVSCDPKMANCIIIAEPYKPRAISHQKEVNNADYVQLYKESFEGDGITDGVFELRYTHSNNNVEYARFAIHKYIIRSVSEHLYKKLDEIIEDIEPTVFKYLLDSVYSGTILDLENVIRNTNGSTSKDTAISVIQYGMQFKLPAYRKNFERMWIDNRLFETVNSPKHCAVLLKKYIFNDPPSGFSEHYQTFTARHQLEFNPVKFDDLWDVRLRCLDDESVSAHKCILVARCEYFRGLTTGYFSEATSGTGEYKLQAKASVLSDLLHYLYTNNFKSSSAKDYNYWCSVMLLADQYLLDEAKYDAAKFLIPYINESNACEFLSFFMSLRFSKLNSYCYLLMSKNLLNLMKSGDLASLDNYLLEELSKFINEHGNCKSGLKKDKLLILNDTTEIMDEILKYSDRTPTNWFSDISHTPRKAKLPNRKLPGRSPHPVLKPREIRNDSDPTPDRSLSELEPVPCSNVPYDTCITSLAPAPADDLSKWERLPSSDKCSPANKEYCWKTVDNTKHPRTEVREEPQDNLRPPQSHSPLNVPRWCNSIPLEEFVLLNPPKSEPSTSLGTKNYFGSKQKAKKNRRRHESTSSCTRELRGWNLADISSPEPVDLATIMCSEQKTKTDVKTEETLKTMKTLETAIEEEKAIQALAIFYGADSVDDEWLIVERVGSTTKSVPLWIPKTD